MMRVTFVIGAVAFLCGTAAAEPLSVTVVSPCECRGNHGTGRLTVKNDPSTRLQMRAQFKPSRCQTWVGRELASN